MEYSCAGCEFSYYKDGQYWCEVLPIIDQERNCYIPKEVFEPDFIDPKLYKS